MLNVCSRAVCKTEKEKRHPHPTQTDITVNAESTGHRPTTDLGPHDIHPKGAKPDTQLTLLSRYTSPDTHLSRHLSRHLSTLCGVSAPTLWCQRPDTSAPRHTQQQRPDTAPTLPNIPRDTLQHCRAQRRVESPVRGTAGTRNDAACVPVCALRT